MRYTPSFKHFLPIVITLCCFGIYSCKKEKQTTIVYDFTYTSTLSSGGTIVNFHTNVPTRNTLAWDFGDSYTSSDTAPQHVYVSNGPYKVTLTVNNDSTHATNKTIYFGYDPVFTRSMTGSKLYHTTCEIYNYRSDSIDSTYIIADKTFSIDYVDPGHVTIGRDTFTYHSTTNSDSVLNFFERINYPIPYYYFDYYKIAFNHFTNSVVVEKKMFSAVSVFYDTTYHSP